MVNTCPVCGYLMRFPAADFHICPSCGTEFGYDDAGRSHDILRAEWLRSGARWWSTEPQPLYWDGRAQLNKMLLLNPPMQQHQAYTVVLSSNNSMNSPWNTTVSWQRQRRNKRHWTVPLTGNSTVLAYNE